ncbi:6-phosphogluconolactonase [Leptospira santarosai]|uniref:6-phosphogluconolactonase n=1 Tax=Leptospira santarosai TaxID=28183 RepID=UPI0002C00CBE|nr:6-phosphogluconolactonase [Leptospira santarosai]ASV10819.1 6-phosphogluconolactonase [Leptospira santarosai]EMO70377.1 6-phosphogluconolactonase [Leptospira santarosai str. 200403458]EMO96796.1 6-phosphogluconolactonase [Leptospira santarosai str. 200702252]EMP04106.1 6-phosphogluconolactonase [Leptospira santarosai str. HAI1380]EMP81353.1 6-phosphogluconolactonase [Leptospira santarosai str. CBC1531]
MQIIEFSDEQRFLTHCLNQIEKISQDAIQFKNFFHIVLTGGDTARLLYSKLKDLKTDWSKWLFYFGDERCVPESHPDSNSFMVNESLFKFIPISEEQIFKIPAHMGAKDAAVEYARSIQSILTFDLVLLGLGEDGHIASLFPGMDLSQEKDIIEIYDSPKLPKERISLSLRKINSSDCILIIAKGRKKKEIIERIKMGETLPVTSLFPKKSIELCYFYD